MDEPGGQKPSSWKVGYHIRGMVPTPTLMMELGEESTFLEADCHTQGTTPAVLSMLKHGEVSSPLEVDFHTRDTASSPIVSCSGLRMDSLPPQVGREVPAHALASMAIASGVAVVAHGGRASQVERMAPGTSGLNCLADTGRTAARPVRHSPYAERETEVVTRDEVPLADRGMWV